MMRILVNLLRAATMCLLAASTFISCGKDTVDFPKEPDKTPTPAPKPNPNEKIEKYQDAYEIIINEDESKYSSALELLKESSALGNDNADFMLGMCYEYNLGTATDMKTAIDWYTKAADSGNKDAKAKLQLINDANSHISLPEKSKVTPHDLIIINGHELSDVNGDGSFQTTSEKVEAVNSKGDLVYLSFQYPGATTRAASDGVTLDATETASSLLMWCVPTAFISKTKTSFDKLKKLISELPETQTFASAIDASIVKNGSIVFEEVAPSAKLAADKITSLIGLDKVLADTRATLSSRSNSNKVNLTRASLLPVVNKPSVKSYTHYQGVITEMDDVVFDPSKNAWKADFTIYNSEPIYLAIVPGKYDWKTNSYVPKTDLILDCVAEPQNMTYLYDIAGVNGVSASVSAIKDFMSQNWEMIKDVAQWDWSKFVDDMEKGISNSTKTQFSMDITSEDDVLMVCSTDFSNELFLYSAFNIIAFPIFELVASGIDFSKISKNTDLLQSIISTIILQSPNLVLKLRNSIEKRSTDDLWDALEELYGEVLKAMADTTFETILDNCLLPGHKGGALDIINEEMHTYKGPWGELMGRTRLELKIYQLCANSISWFLYQSTFKTFYVPINIDPHDPISTKYVDLGLSVKWADKNVGAERPYDNGDYYAWGEIQHKFDYRWATHKWYDRSVSGYKTPYSGTATLKQSDDVATVEWGLNWRTPTKNEISELMDKCYWEWTTSYMGKKVNGYIVYKAKSSADAGVIKYANNKTSRAGSSYNYETDAHIFLPAAGGINDADNPEQFYSQMKNYTHDVGYYWSSSKTEGNNSYCLHLGANVDRFYMFCYYPFYFGFSIRPVFAQ